MIQLSFINSMLMVHNVHRIIHIKARTVAIKDGGESNYNTIRPNSKKYNDVLLFLKKDLLHGPCLVQYGLITYDEHKPILNHDRPFLYKLWNCNELLIEHGVTFGCLQNSHFA